MEVQNVQRTHNTLVERDQDSTTQNAQAATETVNQARSVPGKFFVSPILKFDSRALTVIFQIRDRESGDVTRQFPAEAVVERYRNDPTTRPFVPSVPTDVDNGEPAVIELASGPPAAETSSSTASFDSGPPTIATSSVPASPLLAPTVDLVA